MQKRTSNISSWILVIITLLVIIVGSVLNKTVSLKYEEISIRRFIDPLFILGYVLIIFRGFTWLFALKKLPLSKAYPYLSLSFPLVLFASYFVFNEQITISKVSGSLFIPQSPVYLQIRSCSNGWSVSYPGSEWECRW